MRLLVDTVVLLWIAANDDRLSTAARDAFADPTAELFFSSVSAWEIAVKAGLGKLDLPEQPARWVRSRREHYKLQSLPLTEEDVARHETLDPLHRDPFDRMLICQALQHGLALMTPDRVIARYPVTTVW